ncbi:MAG: phosphotriesterase-related protein [Chloroflexi bacterium]|nr:phosphotriesterase-related protein [Chloroflexota bacterium]
MADFNIAGKVQTVLGPAAPVELGITLTHEHLLIDMSPVFEAPEQAGAKGFYYEPVSIETVGRIRHWGVRNLDNVQLTDVDTAIDEANIFKQYGGGSLVDATSIGIKRDAEGLARISRATGVNIVMGASYYVDAAHPANMDDLSEDDLVRQIVSDVTDGVDGTPYRSGVIGEVGCSWPLMPNERKALRASARAQRITGAPILIHPGRDETAPLEIIEVLREAGADLERTIIGHLDRTVFLHDTLQKIAESGCYMEWDLFGSEESYYGANPAIDMPGDGKRMDDIAWIAAQGYEHKILVAHDICTKNRLERYGGHGYAYILGRIVPRMRARGFSQEAIDSILVGNPANALTFSEPEETK